MNPSEERIAHYRILAPLGSGGMGAVYRAHDERLDRPVALKLLPATTKTDPVARARMFREARTAATLNHPQIAQVYEVGEDEDRIFIAMELVEGSTLKEAIPAGGIAMERLMSYALQAADGLACAHERGVIHRDLKSVNLMVTAEGRVKILDFGLAKKVGRPVTESSWAEPDITHTGDILGTPKSMAPELLRGAPADERSDIWAFGVVLYEMATGRTPFEGRTVTQVMAAILEGEPPPLSPTLPAELRRIIERCLAAEPARRYATGRELHAALLALSLSEAWSGAGRQPTGRAWPVVGLGAAAVLLVTYAGSAGRFDWANLLAPSPRIASLAVLPLTHPTTDPSEEYFADGMTEELITNLAPTPSLKVISRNSVMRFKNSTQSLSEIARQLGVDAIVEGSVRRDAGRVRISAQLIEASSDRHLWARSFERDYREVLTLQSEVAREIAQQIRRELAPQVNERLARRNLVDPRAYELHLRGRHEWSKLTDESLRRAIDLFEQALAIDPHDARSSSGIADAYVLLALVTSTIPPHEGMAKAREYALRAIADDPNSAESHTSNAAALFFGDWNLPEAERANRRALELNPNYAPAHLLASNLRASRGDTAAALEHDRQALELDPLSMIVHWNLIRTLRLAHRFDEALARARRALDADPNAPLVRDMVREICEQKGDYAAALEAFEQAVPADSIGRAALARMRRSFDQSGERGYWQSRLELALEGGGPGAEPMRLAILHARLGHKELALDHLERAREARATDILFIRAEPSFDTLHGEPRFLALAQPPAGETTAATSGP